MAHVHAAHDEQRAERERDHDRGPEVGLGHDQERHHARHEDQRPHALERARAGRLGRDQPGGVEDERELRELGGLDLERPRPEPAAGAVRLDAEAGQQDEQEPCDRGHQERGRVALRDLHAVAREEAERDQAEGRREEIALEVLGAVAAAVQKRCSRARAVDHHRAERDQAERRRAEHRVLERHRRALRARALEVGQLHASSGSAWTSARKRSPRFA